MLFACWKEQDQHNTPCASTPSRVPSSTHLLPPGAHQSHNLGNGRGSLQVGGMTNHGQKNPLPHNNNLKGKEYQMCSLATQHNPSWWARLTSGEQWNELVKGVGIVQPAMQTQHRVSLRVSPGFGYHMSPWHKELQLWEHAQNRVMSLESRVLGKGPGGLVNGVELWKA